MSMYMRKYIAIVQQDGRVTEGLVQAGTLHVVPQHGFRIHGHT